MKPTISARGADTWRESKHRFGPIRRGQLWAKRDTGKVMQVWAKMPNDKWQVRFISGEHTHALRTRDVYKYYERVESAARGRGDGEIKSP